MTLVHPKSAQCVPEELNLFQAPFTNAAFTDGYWNEIPRVGQLSTETPIEFFQSGSDNDYTSLYHSYMFLEGQVAYAQGGKLVQDAPVVPINNFMHSMFSQVEFTLNDVLVDTTQTTYPQKAYIQNLFSSSAEMKKNTNGLCGVVQ